MFYSRGRTSEMSHESQDSYERVPGSQPQTYLASTSFGRLFRLTLVSSGGKQHILCHPFSRPQASLSLATLIPGLWSNPSTVAPKEGRANAVTLGASTPTGTDVWALIETRVQKWNMSVEGWEKIVLDHDLGGLIRPAIRMEFPSAPVEDGPLDLELLDFAFERHTLIASNTGRIVILVSFAGKEERMATDTIGPRRVYALVRIYYESDAFMVESVSSVPYQSVCASSPVLYTLVIFSS